mmetsp:Transcript_113019/g.319750  ORF Transcript_113019/g.319750 Transcript_113019/m.319750 type:complete len:251 (-) Transcript_113019:39-791(-)
MPPASCLHGLDLFAVDNQTANLADIVLLILFEPSLLEVLDATLCRLRISNNVSRLVELSVVRRTFCTPEFLRHILPEGRELLLLLFWHPERAVLLFRDPLLVQTDAPVHVLQHALQLYSKIAAPLPLVALSLGVGIEHLLEMLVVVRAASSQVHLRVLEEVVRAETDQIVPANIAVGEFADPALFWFRVPVGTHQAVEEGPRVIHDGDTTNARGELDAMTPARARVWLARSNEPARPKLKAKRHQGWIGT